MFLSEIIYSLRWENLIWIPAWTGDWSSSLNDPFYLYKLWNSWPTCLSQQLSPLVWHESGIHFLYITSKHNWAKTSKAKDIQCYFMIICTLFGYIICIAHPTRGIGKPYNSCHKTTVSSPHQFCLIMSIWFKHTTPFL